MILTYTLALNLRQSHLSGGEARAFLVAELALFGVSLLLTLFVGRPGKLLGVGVALGLALAMLLAIVVSNYCIDGDCGDGGAGFLLGLLLAGALYPGWALGVGVGTLVRGLSAGESNR
jgi:hypothetical protein